MDKKKLYFELLSDMVYIINQHKITQEENLDFMMKMMSVMMNDPAPVGFEKW